METVHEIRVSYDCNACKLTGFKSKLALRIHVLNFHQLRCCLCRKKFESNAELLAHRKKHNDEPYDCRICGKSFSSKSILVQHSFIQHPLTAFSCRECVQVVQFIKFGVVCHGLDILMILTIQSPYHSYKFRHARAT